MKMYTLSKPTLLKIFLGILILFIVVDATFGRQKVYVRANQVGYLPDDVKNFVVMSLSPLSRKEFRILNFYGESPVFSGSLKRLNGKSGKFKYIYSGDFSAFKKRGKYFIQVGKARSYSFSIGGRIYNSIVDSLLVFFKVQRCGYTKPYYHEVCHKSDATSLIINGQKVNKKHDVTGGWHDAGDYIKFLNTTAFSTYMLLFAYDFDPIKFGFDDDKDGVPDVLAEAKVGLDWLQRAVYKKFKLITQVQDLRDHDVGWRLPENDPLTFDRPAFVGIGKNLIGIYTATMALASRIWRIRFNYPEYAEKCLTDAENIFSVRTHVPDIDSTGTGMYIDSKYKGKLALGAVELYMTTRRPELLDEAKRLAAEAGADYWWSWGDVNALADFRLARIDTSFKKYLKQNLEHFKKVSASHVFGEGTDYTWGTNVTLLGVTLQQILWKNLTNESNYDTIACIQRDYVLGRNPWGVSFISKIGKEYSKNFHHQISYFRNGYLPGGFAAGPIKRKVFDDYKIHFATPDRFAFFQPDSVIYRDDINDYLTNEPTIVGNATAVFVMGYFSER